MILARLKAYALSALAIASAVLFGWLQWTRAAREKERREQAEAVRDIERRATAAVLEGERKIEEARRAPVDTARRDAFDAD